MQVIGKVLLILLILAISGIFISIKSEHNFSSDRYSFISKITDSVQNESESDTDIAYGEDTITCTNMNEGKTGLMDKIAPFSY
ncbi:MAG: hypothetical protein JW894_08880 [Bacteroidales bacterium]|nr:hypothetical protein [Bacteroidales bacterium]